MGFHPEFTGRENARMNAALLGLTGPEIRRRLPEIRDFAELGDFFDRPVRTYSSGMALRLAFAVATHADAEVLIVDEALAVGDGYFQKKSIDRITDFQKRGGTLLFCSHALYYVALLCDQAIWLKQGVVAAAGPALSVVRAYEAFLQEKERGRVPETDRPPEAAAGTNGRRPARFTEVIVHDGSGYPRAKFAAGETVAVDLAFETEDPDLAFQLRVGADREDGVQAFAVDTRGEPWAPLTGRRRYRLRLVFPELADRAGRLPPLRVPRRRDGPSPARLADRQARFLGRRAGLRGRTPAPAARLERRRRGSPRRDAGRAFRRRLLTNALAFLRGPILRTTAAPLPPALAPSDFERRGVRRFRRRTRPRGVCRRGGMPHRARRERAAVVRVPVPGSGAGQDSRGRDRAGRPGPPRTLCASSRHRAGAGQHGHSNPADTVRPPRSASGPPIFRLSRARPSPACSSGCLPASTAGSAIRHFRAVAFDDLSQTGAARAHAARSLPAFGGCSTWAAARAGSSAALRSRANGALGDRHREGLRIGRTCPRDVWTA